MLLGLWDRVHIDSGERAGGDRKFRMCTCINMWGCRYPNISRKWWVGGSKLNGNWWMGGVRGWGDVYKNSKKKEWIIKYGGLGSHLDFRIWGKSNPDWIVGRLAPVEPKIPIIVVRYGTWILRYAISVTAIQQYGNTATRLGTSCFFKFAMIRCDTRRPVTHSRVCVMCKCSKKNQLAMYFWGKRNL